MCWWHNQSIHSRTPLTSCSSSTSQAQEISVCPQSVQIWMSAIHIVLYEPQQTRFCFTIFIFKATKASKLQKVNSNWLKVNRYYRAFCPPVPINLPLTKCFLCLAGLHRRKPFSTGACRWSTTWAPSNTCDETASSIAEPRNILHTY